MYLKTYIYLCVYFIQHNVKLKKAQLFRPHEFRWPCLQNYSQSGTKGTGDPVCSNFLLNWAVHVFLSSHYHENIKIMRALPCPILHYYHRHKHTANPKTLLTMVLQIVSEIAHRGDSMTFSIGNKLL